MKKLITLLTLAIIVSCGPTQEELNKKLIYKPGDICITKTNDTIIICSLTYVYSYNSDAIYSVNFIKNNKIVPDLIDCEPQIIVRKLELLPNETLNEYLTRTQ